MDETTRILQDLLTRAAAAHGVHERDVLGGVYDEQWPRWYAVHMSATLDDLGLRLVPVDPADASPTETSVSEERGEAAQATQ